MKSIQDAGREILTNNPCKMYVFTGEEYGIKKRYLSILSSYYGSSKEYEKVEDVLSIFRSKRLIKLQPCLYIVRYDEDFIKSLNDRSENDIRKLNICGTIVLLYENSKHSSKLEKYLPSYTTSVDSVNINFMVKYILSEFKNMSEKTARDVCEISSNYGQAQNISSCLSLLSSQESGNISKLSMMELFGKESISNDSMIKTGVASKNFKYLISVLERYNDDKDKIFYSILSTMLDLDKLKSNPYFDCEAKAYAKYWSGPDIYYMFVNTYSMLKLSRSYNNFDIDNALIYLFSLLQFDHVPSEVELV